MSLCPLAIASKGNEDGSGEYYFALGNADGSGGLVMSTPAGVPQWTIGMENVPAGGNTGNDFILASYDDAGVSNGAPLLINRATGSMTFAGVNTTSINQFAAGTPTTVGGGIILANGPSGVSRVYDRTYNKPYGNEVLLGQFDNTGASTTSLPFTAATTGLYSLTLSVSVAASGLAWTNGTTALFAYGLLAGGAPVSDSYLVCDNVVTPAVTIVPIGAPNYYIKDYVAIISLNAGETITATVQTQGGMNLGTTGGIAMYIQPLIA